ncbi:YbaB/EbfC family nucleoid-associated protein [Salininema proteolyticum]|uniref:YbaB/EbfC family nucleoid-associated protein n=1 Tax=Salininema proteolyticum TaxID=1607685 RepID=A0ABV8U4G6_9ACTN
MASETESPQAMLKKFEDMNRDLSERLERLKEARAEMEELRTETTDDREVVTITVTGEGKFDKVSIAPVGMRLKEELGPILTRAFARAQERHAARLQEVRLRAARESQ